MIYSSWDMKRTRQNFFVILGHVLPFHLPNSLKNKNEKKKKKWKKYLEISSFYKSVPNIMICYTVPEIWHVMDVIVIFHLTIFCPFTPPPCPYSPKKSKFQKSEKKSWRNHHFTHVYQKLLDDVQFLTYGVQQTDGQTDRKSDIHRWVPHLKNF